MDLGLQDKVVIVTGGSKGIGYGICTVLAEEGAIPFIIGRTEPDVKAAVERIHKAGGRAGFAIAELTDADACRSAVSMAAEKYGRIDALVNNAGVNDGVGLESGNYEDFIRSLHRNLTHYYTITHFSLPHLKKSQTAAIVNIGSKTSLTGQGNTSGYAAANGGRNALTREWAVELLPYGIRVNAVLVAECFTPLYKRWIHSFEDWEEKLRKIEERIPLGQRMTTAKEIADTVTFLLSPRSGHTTGQLVCVDGGYIHLDRAL